MLVHGSRRLSIAVVSALCAWAPFVRADEPVDTLDLRCLIVSLQMRNSDNAEIKAASQVTMMYYLGRLQHRNSTVDLFEPIVKAMSSWTAADFSSEAARCGREIQQAGLDLKSVGQRLVQRGQQINDEATSGSAAKSPPSKTDKTPK
jgi:hypothetical protein